MNGPRTQPDRVEELERQVERLSAYVQTKLGEAALHVRELERLLYGMLDVLLAKEVVTSDGVRAAADEVRRELIARGEVVPALVAMRVDTAPTPPAVKVDCAARMHVCHAVCCKLNFALSAGEIESGDVKWDLGKPYFIRHDDDGYCHHNDRATGGCGVYACRPAICRTYSCAGDTRIWKDFERMELNTEWLDANLSGPSRPHLVRTLMQAGS
jgi:Fe-S-cluster containining protein